VARDVVAGRLRFDEDRGDEAHISARVQRASLDDMTGSEATGRPKERLLARALVELADTLVADFDMLEFLHGLTARCVELLDAAAAGLAVTDQRGRLRVIASSSEQARLLELFELQNHEGPCLVCFRTGQPVTDPDLGQVNQLWPRFAAQARNSGFRSVHVVPMRLREEIIGSLLLFRTEPGHLTEEDAHAGRALADVGTIGILQERAVRDRAVLDEQLETALDSRVIIEQAKGILAERGRIGMHEAFGRLRDYARGRNQPLREVARGVIEGRVDIAKVTDPALGRQPATPPE
jgi:GAF domain-containing protein